jgi:hypothetical protein
MLSRALRYWNSLVLTAYIRTVRSRASFVHGSFAGISGGNRLLTNMNRYYASQSDFRESAEDGFRKSCFREARSNRRTGKSLSIFIRATIPDEGTSIASPYRTRDLICWAT